MSLLVCKNLSFAYDGTTVVHNLNFKVEQGDYLCIVGENGAGKSTLIKGLLQLKKPSSGSITMGEGLKASEIGYLPQQTQIQKDFPASVREVVMSGFLGAHGLSPFYSAADWRSPTCPAAVTGTCPAASSRESFWPGPCARPGS